MFVEGVVAEECNKVSCFFLICYSVSCYNRFAGNFTLNKVTRKTGEDQHPSFDDHQFLPHTVKY